jgi:hypothetical protein
MHVEQLMQTYAHVQRSQRVVCVFNNLCERYDVEQSLRAGTRVEQSLRITKYV